MRNIVLRPFYKDLYFRVAQYIFSENRIHAVAAVENVYKNEEGREACDFAKVCKNFSLPVTVLDRQFQILSQGETVPCFSLNYKEYDAAVSLFNLHSMDREEQILFIRQMKQSAPKAIFLEYENPERNMAYLGYLPVILGEYATVLYEKRVNGKKNASFAKTKKYLENGALEGILHDLPQILPNTSPTVVMRKNLGIGGIGMACVEWN